MKNETATYVIDLLDTIKKQAHGSAQILLINIDRLARKDKNVLNAFREACIISGVTDLRSAIINSGKALAEQVNTPDGQGADMFNGSYKEKRYTLDTLRRLIFGKGINMHTAYVAYDTKHRYYFAVPYARALKVWHGVKVDFTPRKTSDTVKQER